MKIIQATQSWQNTSVRLMIIVNSSDEKNTENTEDFFNYNVVYLSTRCTQNTEAYLIRLNVPYTTVSTKLQT